MNAKLASVTEYLAVQIREIVGYGALHTLTWASKTDPTQWLQLSVHWGNDCHFMVQCLLPAGAKKEDVDGALGQIGWVTTQAYNNHCLIYYLARCHSFAELHERAAETARQLAAAMAILWKVSDSEAVVLLGACGPRLALRRIAAIAAAPTAPAIIG